MKRGLASARLTLANSAAIARRAHDLGATTTRIVHLGTEVPDRPPRHDGRRLVTVAHLVARKRHADVLRALWLLRDRHPDARWSVVGDGPERPALERLAGELEIADRVDFHGALPHSEALQAAQTAAVCVLPSVDEAFGVAYIEAMAGAVPAIGCTQEPGPEEIASCGDGIRLVPPADPEALAKTLDALLSDENERRRLGGAARETVLEHFTWERCGRATVAAYEEALAR